jgi:hypothetical protein
LSDQNSKFPIDAGSKPRAVDEEKLVQDYSLALQKTLEAKRRDPSNRSTEMHEQLIAAVEALSKWKKPEAEGGHVIQLFSNNNDDEEKGQDS